MMTTVVQGTRERSMAIYSEVVITHKRSRLINYAYGHFVVKHRRKEREGERGGGRKEGRKEGRKMADLGVPIFL